MLLYYERTCSRTRDFFKLNAFIDTMKLNPLHRIIAGLAQADSATLIDIIKLKPALLNEKDALGFSPLQWALMKEDFSTLKILLDAGADTDPFFAIDICRTTRRSSILHPPDMSGLRNIINHLFRDSPTPVVLRIRDGGDQ